MLNLLLLLLLLLCSIIDNNVLRFTKTEQQTQNEAVSQNEAFFSTEIVRQSQLSFNELVVEKEIGEGSYGKVCVGKWNRARVAIKFCRNKAKLDEFIHEVRLIMYVCV
jgi:hypothetical protein